jgi:hypothetical protein
MRSALLDPAHPIYPPRGLSVLLPSLYDIIGRYVYLFERLTPVSGGRFYRFEHIVTYSSGKVIAK